MSQPTETLYDPDDSDSYVPRSPRLQKVQPHLGPEEDPVFAPAPVRTVRGKKGRPFSRRRDPCQFAVLQLLAPNNPEFSKYDPNGHGSSSETESDDNSEMTEIADEPEKPPVGDIRSDGTVVTSSGPNPKGTSNAKPDVSAIANAALEHQAQSEDQAQSETQESGSDFLSKSRVDSGHAEVLQPQQENCQQPGRVADLWLETQYSAPPPRADDTIAASPTLWKHVIPVSEGAVGTLPALQANSPTKDGPATSPKPEKLPSVRQITMGDTLSELAEAATQQDPRGQPYTHHHHSQSLGSTTAQSPMVPYHPYPSAQPSPSNHYNISARSPTSVVSDHHYGSPPQYPNSAYFTARRSSTAAGSTPNFPASLPSASSSGDSHGPANSSIDGYTPSTSHTTPIDATPAAEATPRHVLPPPPGMPVMTGFKCDYPGCTASPFQTQYLLSSHRNVHSQTRNHFCPVEGCARGENGRGFKRKNEMKRHALVHKSPGYTCPFCPEEHKYPRPDNLQRHVRVHHVDKDRDDPLLREVLAQRSDGTNKAARRRRNTSASV